MPRLESKFGQHNNDDIIRDISREYSSREKPIGIGSIIEIAGKKGFNIGKDAIRGLKTRMGANVYET